MKTVNLDWLLAGAALAALGTVRRILAVRARRPTDPEAIERERREHVNRVGRIVEGKILDVVVEDAERPPPAPSMPLAAAMPGKRRWIVYSYLISGVTYQTAQEVSSFTIGAGPAVGRVASVKYDPANPSSSILVAEDWSGLP
ncbi:MAG TPA: hypothetical protein VGS20_13880 [Candidatus Acidoferrales bacterium]|nr:hypothetical protein [Candidatus Acidoferrales bacterium]